ncbi:MAG: hypothetical protein BWY17_04959 [Deltaproteobacteria bacterium ADurb.Bin207]|nr:MAG: hypothetical protein BWY17_04959 [Deltaproteobacteria bacterium ADurb.Bin207]
MTYSHPCPTDDTYPPVHCNRPPSCMDDTGAKPADDIAAVATKDKGNTQAHTPSARTQAPRRAGYTLPNQAKPLPQAPSPHSSPQSGNPLHTCRNVRPKHIAPHYPKTDRRQSRCSHCRFRRIAPPWVPSPCIPSRTARCPFDRPRSPHIPLPPPSDRQDKAAKTEAPMCQSPDPRCRPAHCSHHQSRCIPRGMAPWQNRQTIARRDRRFAPRKFQKD